MFAQQHELFALVKIPSEKKRILREMIQAGSEIVLKGEKADALYFLKPTKISENRWIICQEVSDLGLQDESQAIANFSIGNERYFFQTPVQVSPISVLLETEVDLYHLQRRKSLRVALPKDAGANCSIINHRSISCLYDCNIIDFSKGGIRLAYPAPLPLFRDNDTLTMSIRLGQHRRSFQIEGIIRHSSEATSSEQFFGVQFVNMNRTLEQKLLTLQMDLQSEIFRKWRSNHK